MYKSYFSEAFRANPDILHFAAHSHHYWPDVTLKAMQDYWYDSVRYSDNKWEKIFRVVIPEAQRNIAAVAGFSHPENIAFAPNTHEFITRIFSCFDLGKGLKILTTDSEFHSLSRQLRRLEENDNIKVMRVPSEPFETFSERFISELENDNFDLVFLSHVFYNSGYFVRNIHDIYNKVPNRSIFILDGYHSFFAIPFSLREIEERTFFLGGGYKYLMSGEGVCYLHIPAGCELRPVNTGWFADFGNISGKQIGNVGYSNDAFRFWGATFDPTGLYRLNAVFRWLNETGLNVGIIRKLVVGLQEQFMGNLRIIKNKELNIDNLISSPDHNFRGNFLTFRNDNAGDIHNKLKDRKVLTDYRGDRLRFGFAIYHDESDINKLTDIISSI